MQLSILGDIMGIAGSIVGFICKALVWGVMVPSGRTWRAMHQRFTPKVILSQFRELVHELDHELDHERLIHELFSSICDPFVNPGS